jgi:hypothetical protein
MPSSSPDDPSGFLQIGGRRENMTRARLNYRKNHEDLVL